ncbi:MAG: hypothetical protein Q4A52_06590 [Bacillota bacterium]|nr:hypothetical protein [Bacillota bacterium]
MELLILASVFALPFVVLTIIGLYSVGGMKQRKQNAMRPEDPSIDPDRCNHYEVLVRAMSEGVIVLDSDLNSVYPLSETTVRLVKSTDLFFRVFFDSVVGISGSRLLLESAFKQSSQEAVERILSYFPAVLRIDGKELHLRYHYDASARHLYLFITDYSEQNHKEAQLAETIHVQDMVINVLKHRVEYSRLMREMNERTVAVLDRIYNDSTDVQEFKLQFITELVRIRNDLRLFNMSKSIGNIRAMEQAVQNLPDDVSIGEVRHLLPATDWFSLTAEDRDDMVSYLNDSFLAGNSIVVNKEWLSQLELIIDTIPDPVHQKQIDEIVLKIKMTEIQEITRDFDRIIQKKAEAMGKKINPIHLTYGFLTYDREFIQSIMMDVFSLLDGSLEFGIEHPASRFRRGKPERGTIHINLRQESEDLVVEYADDGVGVEPSRFAHVCETFRVREGGVVGGTFVPTIKSLSSALQALNHKIREKSGTLSFESIYGQYMKFIIRVPYRAYLEQKPR